MTVIPDNISNSERLTHALFAKDDVRRNPFWVKHKALIPPSKNPHEVSFSRACYLPDNMQKALCLEIPRQGKKFAGFIGITPLQLEQAMEKLLLEYVSNGVKGFPFSIYFKYTPVFEKGNKDPWPEGTDKIFGIGYNAAHADLYYEEPIRRGEPHVHHTAFAYLITDKKEGLCTVFEESDSGDPRHWNGPELC